MNGIINLDSKFAKTIGFTSEKFNGYLWKKGRVIIVSFIISLQEGQGNFLKLIKNIQKQKYIIHVPTPSARMRKIMREAGAKEIVEHDATLGPVEIMELLP